jgi:drug/metabolite transporter (DMT)-like permease
MASAKREWALGTLLGILAVLLWGSTIAAIRSVVEQLGALGAGGFANLIGGGLLCLVLAAQPGRLRRAVALPRQYLVGCGLLFVAYCPPLYLAMYWSATREQAVQVALINYLWPAMTLALSVPILRKRARPTLAPAICLALAGVYLAMAQGGAVSWQSFRHNIASNPWPYAMAFMAAALWALYSALSCRWAGNLSDTAVPFFLLATGLILVIAWWAEGATIRHPWTRRSVMELLYLALLPTLLAYWFWDVAMRKGNIILVTSLSFFIPLISTAMSCFYLGVAAGPSLWLACLLVVGGAVLCKLSILEPPRQGDRERKTGPPAAGTVLESCGGGL